MRPAQASQRAGWSWFPGACRPPGAQATAPLQASSPAALWPSVLPRPAPSPQTRPRVDGYIRLGLTDGMGCVCHSMAA